LQRAGLQKSEIASTISENPKSQAPNLKQKIQKGNKKAFKEERNAAGPLFFFAFFRFPFLFAI
jgi:hypothetical protein